MMMILLILFVVIGMLVWYSGVFAAKSEEQKLLKLKQWEKQALADAEADGKGAEHARAFLMEKVGKNNEGLTSSDANWMDPEIAAFGASERHY